MPENDVFISYASRDNRPLTEGQAGWVRSFQRLLREHLEMYTGNRQVSVWFDEREMDALTPITPAILGAVRESHLMVSVVSPSYINSRWCMEELNHFRTVKEQGGGLLLDGKSLLVKVAKIPVEAEEMPEVFRDLKGVEFYQPDGTDGMPKWFGLEESDEARRIFIDRVRSLAYSISGVIKELKRRATARNPLAVAAATASPPSGPYIYLAEPTPDLKEDCALLRVELERSGHRVYSLDDEGLPRSVAELERRVRDKMRGCRLAIHMVGAEYGETPSDDIRSYSFLENTYAAEVEQTASFSRLIWIPQGVEPGETTQERFLDMIRSTNWPSRTEWLENSFGDFKAIIDEKIKADARPVAPAPAPTPSGKPRIYVVFDAQDTEPGSAHAAPLARDGFPLIGPTQSGDVSALAEAHRSKLNLCDAVLIVWDKVPDTWVHEKVADLEKAMGYGRKEPFRATAVLITGEPTFEKRFFRMPQGLVVKRLSDGTQESSLDDFIRLLH